MLVAGRKSHTNSAHCTKYSACTSGYQMNSCQMEIEYILKINPIYIESLAQNEHLEGSQ